MMNRSDARDYEIHVVVVEKLRKDPEAVIRRALENLRRWQSPGAVPAYTEWERVLKRGRAAVESALLDPGALGQRLRSSSPFYGVLTARERMQALDRARRGR